MQSSSAKWSNRTAASSGEVCPLLRSFARLRANTPILDIKCSKRSPIGPSVPASLEPMHRSLRVSTEDNAAGDQLEDDRSRCLSLHSWRGFNPFARLYPSRHVPLNPPEAYRPLSATRRFKADGWLSARLSRSAKHPRKSLQTAFNAIPKAVITKHHGALTTIA